VAVRDDVEVLAVHETVTDPGPLPPAALTVSHDPLPVAVQLPPAQFEGLPVRVTVCDPDDDNGLAEVGLIAKLVQVGRTAAAWVTVIVVPATRAVLVRSV
jgi:hypothetical protein